MTTLTSQELVCETLDSARMLQEARNELARLAEMPGTAADIVQHPDWLLFELQSRGDSASLQLVIVRSDAGLIVGYLPFLVMRGAIRIPAGSLRIPVYRGRMMRMLGSRVVALPMMRKAVEQAISAWIKRDPATRVIQIQESALPNVLADTLSRGSQRFAAVQFNLLEQVNWAISPQPSVADYLAQLDSKRRKKLTYHLRNVYKKLGTDAQLRVFAAPDQMHEYCQLMTQLYPRSWHADAKAIDWELPARCILFQQLADCGGLVGHLLMLGEKPVAYMHGYRINGRYLLDDTGYDEAFASLGVGSALVFQGVQHLIGAYPGDLIDFGYGDNHYKRMLADHSWPCGTLYLVRGVIPSICFSMVAPMRWLYRRVRSMHVRWTMARPSI